MPRGRQPGYIYDINRGWILTAEEERAILEAYYAWPFIQDLGKKMGHGVRTIRKVLDAAGMRHNISVEDSDL